MISAQTRLFALLGDPVGHSLSPLIQNAAARAVDADGVYVALRCGAEDVAGFMRGLSRAGGGGNVTVPHKERAASVLDAPREAVRRTGACNTFWLEGGQVVGDNTDVEGFRQALQHFLGASAAEGQRVLLLGAGGAARAALLALVDDGVNQVCIVNRSGERARSMARRIGGARARVLDGPGEWHDQSFDLVVNATSLGLKPDDELPLDLARLGRAGAVMDLVYGQDGTPFVRHAESLGIRATDGKEMLVRQAAASFELWWKEPAPLEVMRGALEAGS
ncbi:MAG: shikimate dehydrogenase [Gemmatimonadales bacterium]|jgi:shikimate dehydrogenase|nr:MAG: shikimate dehydrogenase [Gemmatimonadales bacterium]